MALAVSEPVAEVLSTSNAATYSFGSFTPTAGALLVVMAFCTGSTTAGTVANSVGTAFTWTRADGTVYNTTDLAEVFWAKVPASPGAITVTYTKGGAGNATGCCLVIFQITGTNVALRQSKANAATAANPTCTFTSAMQTGNAYCAGFGMPRNPPTSAPPTSWTEIADGGYTTPASGCSAAYRNGGETGSTVTFTSLSAAYGMVAVEVWEAPAQSISGAGNIATAGAFGTAKLNQNVSAAGAIASSSAFGTARTATNVTAAGAIATAAAFGTATVGTSAQQVTGAGAIATAFAAGVLALGLRVTGAGAIGSAYASGAPTVLRGAVTLSGAGAIATAAAPGTPTVSPGAVTVSPSGAASSSATGSPTVAPGSVQVSPAGVASAGAVGAPRLGANVTPGGIASGQAAGAPTVAPGAVSVAPSGVASSAAVGAPTASPGAVTVAAAGAIASASSPGSPTVAPGAVTLTGAGAIGSAAAVGAPRLAVWVTAAGAIASGAAFGTAAELSFAPATLHPSGIASAEAFGLAWAHGAPQYITATAIPSAELVAAPRLQLFVRPSGIASGEAWGGVLVAPGPRTVSPPGIPSATGIGAPAITPGRVVLHPSGVASAAIFGAVTVTGQTVVLPAFLYLYDLTIPARAEEMTQLAYARPNTENGRNMVIRQNDTAPPITARLMAGGRPLPALDGASVEFRLSTRAGVVLFRRPATITDPVRAHVSYAWQVGDTATPGYYSGHWIVTFTDGTVRTIPSSGAQQVSITA